MATRTATNPSVQRGFFLFPSENNSGNSATSDNYYLRKPYNNLLTGPYEISISKTRPSNFTFFRVKIHLKKENFQRVGSVICIAYSAILIARKALGNL